MLKGFEHARLACGCRLAFREGTPGSPVTVVIDKAAPGCGNPLHVTDEARQQGMEVRIGKFRAAGLGKAQATGETAGLMIMAAHDLPAVAWSAVTDAARTALGLPPVAVAAGAPADLLAVRATTVREAIANGPPGRLVWKRGVRIDETEH